MLKELSVVGFRGFRLKQTARFAIPNGDRGSGLTIVTGPNNSGKSTLLEVVRLGGGHHRTPSFHVGLRNPEVDTVEIEFKLTDESQAYIRSRGPGSSESDQSLSASFTPYVVQSRRYFSPYFGAGGGTSRQNFAVGSASNPEYRPQSIPGFESRIFDLERNKEKFDLLISRIIPRLNGWSIDQSETGQYFIRLNIGGKVHSTSGAGDGIVSLFTISAALFDSEPGQTIVIDEPELSLHPSFQRRLASRLQEYASDRQIIVATHSPFFAQAESLLAGGSLIRAWEGDRTISLSHLDSQTPDALEALRKLSNLNMFNPHVFGLDAREMFFLEDGVIVFEGQEDVVLWPKLLEPGDPLTAVNVYGWGAGGVSNIQHVCKVLEALGFQQVAGVVNGNRRSDVEPLQCEFPKYQFVSLPGDDIRTKDARPAKAAVEGVLDKEMKIREEHRSDIDGLRRGLIDYFDLKKE